MEKYFEFIGAMESRDYSKVEALLPQIDVEAVADVTRIFPLHLAAASGDKHLLELLLSSPKSQQLINQFDDLSNTPLMNAIAGGHTALAKLLLEAGAEINACDDMNAGNSALKVAVEHGHL